MAWSRDLVRAVAAMRDASGLSNHELIERSGMSPSYFYARMRGDAPFDTNDIERLASALRTHPHEISRLAASLSVDGTLVEWETVAERSELARRIHLIQSTPLSSNTAFEADKVRRVLNERGVTLENGEWESLTDPSASQPVRRRVLEAIAEYAGLPTAYLLDPTDGGATDLAEAQLEFRAALSATGAESVSTRAVGDVSPAALRAIARSLRSITPRPPTT